MLNTRTFNYIDAMPGAGKTEFFVKEAVKLLQSGRGYILVYVAPTAKLLHETYRRVMTKVGVDTMLARVQVVAGPQKTAEAFESTPYHVIGDQPTTALNYLFGLITRQQYLDTKYGAGGSHSLQDNISTGSIVMTTHESFVRVNREDMSGNDFKLVKRMIVIFDEARKCVIQPRDFKIPKDQWRMLWNSLILETVDSEDPLWRKKKGLAKLPLPTGTTPQNLYRVKEVKPIKTILATFGVKVKSLLPDDVKAMLKMHREHAETGRGSIYVLSSMQIQELLEPQGSNEKISVQVVMRPTALFDNYQCVILTSAFFTDSQMYHFLKKDGHKLVPLLKPRNLRADLAAIKDRSARLRTAAATRLHVATLLTPETRSTGGPTAYKENLTSTLLTTGMVVPAQLALDVAGHLDFDLSHRDIVYNLARTGGLKVTTEDPGWKLDKRLRAWAVPPLWPLLHAAATVIRKWVAENGGDKRRSLLALNVNEEKLWFPTGTRYLKTARSMLVYGTLTRKAGYSDSDLQKDGHKRDATLLPSEWKTRLKDILYDRSETSVFTLPNSPTMHGLNKYSKLRAFTHLAALNPSPTQTRFYRMLIPDYNVDQDHSIENLVQTLYRTSLRNPDATEPVLMVIPYEASAVLLAEKIGVKRFRRVNTPPLAVLQHVKRMGEEARDLQRARTQEVNRKYSEPLKQELSLARGRVSAARTSLKKAPDSKARQTTLAKREAEFEVLKAKATLKGKS